MSEPNQPGLVRQLGFPDALSIVVGVVIGAGIFLVPSLVARELPSASAILAVWIAAGVLSFLGGLAMAELGAMIPETGGQYVFIREAYGPMPAFLCGWTSFVVSHSAAVAWLGVSFGLYLSHFIPLSAAAQKAVGLGLIAVLAAVNYRGVLLGAAVQKLLTLAKILGLSVLIVSAFLVKSGPAAAASGFSFRWSAFGVAMIAGVMTYDGWACVGSVAGEIRDPQTNILRALAGGIGISIAVYVAANLAFVHALGVTALAASERPGAELAARTMGNAGGNLLSIVILLSITGAANGWLLTQPRVYFAQARDGLFFRRFGEVQRRYRTPGFSVLMHALWSAVLLLTGSFEVLIDFAMFAMWVFYALTTFGLVILRRTQPDRARPYRMWGYPVTPLLFVATAAWFLVNMAIEKPAPSLAAAGIILAGAPVYFIRTRRSRTEARRTAGISAS